MRATQGIQKGESSIINATRIPNGFIKTDEMTLPLEISITALLVPHEGQGMDVVLFNKQTVRSKSCV